MTDKEKITAILKAYTKKHNISASSVILEEYAEELVANGVIVPPCKVGDVVYKIMDIESVHRQILEVEVLSIRTDGKMKFFVKTVKNYLYRYAEYPIDDFGKTVFLTKEEAEEKLRELKLCDH
jgi:hypothetical protein